MSNLEEMKKRIFNLINIVIDVSGKAFDMAKAAVPDLTVRFKKSGRNFIIGGVIGGIGLAVMAVGALYLVWALVLLLDKAIEELWLSAMIVVGALLLGGGFFALVGLVTAWTSARKIQKTVEATGKDAVTLAKDTADSVTIEVTELQVVGQQEAIKRFRQARDMLNIAYRLAPMGAAFCLLVLLAIRRRWKKKKKKKLALQAPVEVVFKED